MSLVAQAIGTRLWNVGATTLAPLLPFVPPSLPIRFVELSSVRRTFRKAINRFTSGTDTQFTASPRLLITDITDVSFHLHRYTFANWKLQGRPAISNSVPHRNAALDSASCSNSFFNVWYFASYRPVFNAEYLTEVEEFYGSILNMSIFIYRWYQVCDWMVGLFEICWTFRSNFVVIQRLDNL